MNTADAFRMHLNEFKGALLDALQSALKMSRFYHFFELILKFEKKARLFEFYQRLNIKGMHFIHITSSMTSSVTSQSIHDDVMMTSQ